MIEGVETCAAEQPRPPSKKFSFTGAEFKAALRLSFRDLEVGSERAPGNRHRAGLTLLNDVRQLMRDEVQIGIARGMRVRR
jgi:hypothetical protein